MALDDIIQGTIHSVYQGNRNVWSTYLQVLTENDSSKIIDDVEEYLKNDVVPLLIPLHNAGVSFDCTEVRRIWPAPSLPEIAPLVAQGGTRPGAIMVPGQVSKVATLITNQTAISSRNRGRDFWYGMVESDLAVSGSQWDTSYMTAVRDFYVNLTSTHTDGTTGNSYAVGVFSRTQAVENANPLAIGDDGIANQDRPTFGDPPFNLLTLVRSNPLIRTQRRRQPENPCLDFPKSTVPA